MVIGKLSIGCKVRVCTRRYGVDQEGHIGIVSNNDHQRGAYEGNSRYDFCYSVTFLLEDNMKHLHRPGKQWQNQYCEGEIETMEGPW